MSVQTSCPMERGKTTIRRKGGGKKYPSVILWSTELLPVIKMNIGARHNPSSNYDFNRMLEDSNPEKLNESIIRNGILQDMESSFEWFESCATDADFEHGKESVVDDFAMLADGTRNRSTVRVIKACHSILETQMHPTADDVMKGAAKFAVYNICGQRAYNYKVE